MVHARNVDLLPFIESRAIEGERKSTYWCMPAVLNSLFFLFLSSKLSVFSFPLLPTSSFSFYFVLLPFLFNVYFWVMFFSRSSYYRVSESPSQCTARGPL